jgi:hypothetical protein
MPPIPATAFDVHVLKDDDTKGRQLGGSPDRATAIEIANATWLAAQAYNQKANFRVGVFNNSGTLVAFIGSHDG